MELCSLRRLARPARVETCRACGAALGGGYGGCPACTEAIERYWLADWEAALAENAITKGEAGEKLLAEVALGEPERWPWSVLDIAMTRLRCPECHAERGGGPPGCGACAHALGAALWAELWAGRQGRVTGNEHALHVGRWVLRHPHRYPLHSVAGWRLSMPRLLTGWLPSTAEAQRTGRLIKLGRMDEVEAGLRALDAQIAAGAFPHDFS